MSIVVDNVIPPIALLTTYRSERRLDNLCYQQVKLEQFCSVPYSYLHGLNFILLLHRLLSLVISEREAGNKGRDPRHLEGLG